MFSHRNHPGGASTPSVSRRLAHPNSIARALRGSVRLDSIASAPAERRSVAPLPHAGADSIESLTSLRSLSDRARRIDVSQIFSELPVNRPVRRPRHHPFEPYDGKYVDP